MTVGDSSRFSGGRQRILPESYPHCSPLFTNGSVSFRNGRGSGGWWCQGNQTISGLFVIPLFVEKSQYSVLRKRCTWPSRKARFAPRLCRFVWTKLPGFASSVWTPGKFLLSKKITIVMGFGTALIFIE